nr:hypothetical protein [Candidatus Njordarchaeum guaymaensis]
MKEFFIEYNRIVLFAALLTVLLMASLLGAPAAARPEAGLPY